MFTKYLHNVIYKRAKTFFFYFFCYFSFCFINYVTFIEDDHLEWSLYSGSSSNSVVSQLTFIILLYFYRNIIDLFCLLNKIPNTLRNKNLRPLFLSLWWHFFRILWTTSLSALGSCVPSKHVWDWITKERASRKKNLPLEKPIKMVHRLMHIPGILGSIYCSMGKNGENFLHRTY